jgi:hypothetical protein
MRKVVEGSVEPAAPDAAKPVSVIEQPVAETNSAPELLELTIIRIEPEETAPELLLYMQGEMVAVIGNMSYATLELPAGANLLVFDWEDTSIQFQEEIVMDPDWHEERFISVVHHYDVPEISRKDGNVDYTLEETLAIFELPPKYAKGVIENLDPEMSYVFDSEDKR